MSERPDWAIIGLSMLQVCALGTLYAWSVLIAPVQSEYGVSRTATGLVFSLSITIFTLAVTAAPRLFSARRTIIAGALSTLIGAIGLFAAAAAPTFIVFTLSYAGIFALASGLGYASGLQIAVAAGGARSGLATGMVITAFALGAVLFGPLISYISAVEGLAFALSTQAAILAVIAILSLAMQRGRPSFQRRFPAIARKSPHADARAVQRGLVWILWMGFAFGAAGGLMVLGHAAGMVAAQGGNLALAGLAVSLVAAGNATGRLSAGPLADWVGARLVLVLSALLLALATGTMAAVPGALPAAVALALAGLAYGLMATGYPVAVNHLFGPELFGRIYGRVITAWGLAGLVAPLAAGWLYDLTGDYRLPLLLACLAAVVSAAIAFALGRRSTTP
ncbi:MFS transporter [Pseudohoeflea coraliihabitans]|uniref:MFS transporter n=1 Tax=Pseudohoeflea coraliihabitans TaxID=2860393 RepID=A0ABS6WTC6_9HYPH|nr:MFS transporter [Pseudohoeflea sp. DP4N28-3]MBW3098310.1 MFS transporter [Pseudohoeflea sp. DP4N28-3]